MRVVLALVLCAAVASAVILEDRDYEELFTRFVAQYGKQYHANDFFNRYHVFRQNVDLIQKHNAKGASWTMGINHFADLTAEEFKSRLGFNYVKRSYLRSKNAKSLDNIVLQDSIDWVAKGAVTPVKNQGQCGSCWSFSATGSMEGAWQIAKGQLISLSEQMLVDCSSSYGNAGCNGGDMDAAFEYVINNGGLATEAAYPYTAEDGTCNTAVALSGVTISSYVDVTSENETALLAAANIGPVSVAIEADQSVFQFYSGGVLNSDSCGTNLDHGVLVVGYGYDSSSGLNYWKVKNSWGASWGESGYIRMARGSNMCGIAMDPSYPVV